MRTATTMPVYENESLNDDEFLDRLFEFAVEQLENGLSPLPAEIPANRAHLRDEIARLVRIAQAISASPPADLPSLRDYTLIRELGRGGMGSVHLARQERLGRLVALKLMPRASALSARARGRFLSEARAIANLQHPNVVAIHDVIEEDGVLAYAMEWVEGCTLAEAIDAAANSRAGQAFADNPAASTSDPEIGHRLPLDPASVARLGVAVARALAVVHAAGLVHRDVKPSNILLRRDATPLLSDFGLVRAADSSDLTQTGQFLGTLAYAAPEQLRGDSDAIDARSDVYALGATLYHALALQRPFSDPSPKRRRAGPVDDPHPHNSPAIMHRRIESGLAAPLRRQNPLVPRDFETIITKAMDPNPARRYQTAADLADDLERMLSLRPIRARKAGVFSSTIKLARRHRGVLAASVLGAAAALGLAVAAVVYVFFVPRWVEAHVREARLTLLHPDQANGIISQLFWGNSMRRPAELMGADRSIYAGALREYDAALRLAPFDEALRQEREVVAGVVRGEAGQWSDPRSAGLRAYLLFDPAGAIEAWTRWEQSRDPLAPPDPMIDAALGVLYLADDQPARAYPRLNDACRAFPDVGFLTVYLADAAVRCGDLARAEQLLERARLMSRHDPADALGRVTADLLAATGRDAEAEAAYHAHPHVMLRGNGPAMFNYARFLETRGRTQEALERFAGIARSVPGGIRPARAFVRVMDAWWSVMPARERLAHIHAALDENPYEPKSFVFLLRLYEQSRAVLSPDPKDAGARIPSRTPSGGNPFPRNAGLESGGVHDRERILGPALPKSSPIAALVASFSSPSLQSVSLHELATRMEIENMSLWRNIASYPPAFKEFVAVSWHWPAFVPFVRAAAVAMSMVTANAAHADSPCVARVAHRTSYDSARNQLVMFGGSDGANTYGDTRVWDGSLWTALTTSGPGLRWQHAMAYDSARQRVVLYGGLQTNSASRQNDTWEWDGSLWTQRATIGPHAQAHPAMAYDSDRGRMVLFGGRGSIRDEQETWEWDGNTWQLVATTGPARRILASMAYDSARQRTVLFGGVTLDTGPFTYYGDTWEWDGSAWVQVATAGPAARYNGELAYDSSRGRVVLFGGAHEPSIFGDTWEWDGTNWNQISVTGPCARYYHSAEYDSDRGRVVIFGGSEGFSVFGDTWEYGGPTVGWKQVGVGPGDAPIAGAGDDQSLPENTLVTLDGIGSSSCDLPTYAWTQLAGTSVMLDLTDPAHPTFTAPPVPIGGETLTFQLVVSDGNSASAPDSVNVTVTNVNHAPVAAANGPATVAEGGVGALNGSHSYDDDSESLTYSWVQLIGTPVTLSDDTSATPTFTAPFVGFGGESLTFRLIVSDGTDSSAADFVDVAITNVNTLPVASAGVDQTKAEGAGVTLNASASHDDDGDTLTYAWTQVSGATVTLTGGDTASPTFTAPQVGVGGDTLVFRVCVDDGYGGSDCDEVAITVQNVLDGNSPPACNLARPSVAELWPPNHKMVAISVLGVTDPDNNGITITILDVTQDEPIDGLGDGDTSPDAVIQGGSVLLRAERAGNRNGRVYRVTFQAEDGRGGTCTGTVNVCVPHSKGRNAPPCVDDGQLYQSGGH